MPDFSRYSNYKQETAFSSVVFGAKSPVLEAEMNEVQQIIDTKLQRLSKFCGNFVVADTNGSVSFNPSSKVLSITNCTAFAGNLTAFIHSANITLTDSQPTAYLQLKERVVTGSDPIYKNGVTTATRITNTAIDPRVGVETSRRKVVEVSLLKNSALPTSSTPDTLQYIHIGSMKKDGSTYTFDKAVKGSIHEILNEFSAKVDSLVDAFAVRRINVTIPTTGWVSRSSTRYPWYCNISVASATTSMIPCLTVLEAGYDTAIACGLSSRVDTFNGGIVVYAASKPTTAISASLTLCGDASGFSGGMSVNYVLPVATTTTLGGVKASNSVLVDVDGTAHARLDDESFASQEEVEAALNDVYGE